ncbi:hypothetical protein ACT3R7_20010 [Halomonas sp. AOP43-A1-21]
MSYRDLLRMRRQAASSPTSEPDEPMESAVNTDNVHSVTAVTSGETAPVTEKILDNQPCHRCHHCHRPETSCAIANEVKSSTQSTATVHDINTIIGSLYAIDRPLEPIETEVRGVMATLTRQSAAELAVVLDDAFEVAPDTYTALKQCRRLLSDSKALSAAKAVWPNLPHAPASEVPVSAPVVEHAPRWLRLVREHCAVLPEDERLLSKVVSNRPPQKALQIAQRYITTWQKAAEQEPVSHKRDNAGRRAANRELTGGRHVG